MGWWLGARTRATIVSTICNAVAVPPRPVCTALYVLQHDDKARLIGERGRQYALTYLTSEVRLGYQQAVLQQLAARVPLQLSRHARNGPGLPVCCDDIRAEAFVRWGSGGEGHDLDANLQNQLEYYAGVCERMAPQLAGPGCAQGRAPGAPNPLVYAAGAMCA